ncbi:AAA family ATPase [Methylobacterium sp. E-025]|uniref:AAA family ATPase n=1 Tax=Methylobacterium sp. E-025 TaxID=2836561 RepID=UPI001FB97CEF|nr:AAA family ATPase [Methylobacterium sp. E-025]MCJ2114183.1 AAA family ATPase [Methylobacterium sp. E-025]
MSGARNARKQETDMRKNPLRNGAGAPSPRALLLGTPMHRDSHARQLQSEILSTVPGIYSAGRAEMIRQCADSELFYEIVKSLWSASISCVSIKRNQAAAEARFVTAIREARVVLKRTVGVQSASTADLDLGFADRQEQGMLDLLTVLLADLGEAEARVAHVDVAWRYAREREDGEEDLLYGAVGASLHAHEPWRYRGNELTGGSTNFITECIELGRQALVGALPQPEPAWATEAKAKAATASGLRAIEEARLNDGPSMLVLATVDHLPGSAKSGEGTLSGSRGTTARSDWGPFAGRRIRLVAVPDMGRVRRRLVAEFPDAEDLLDGVLAPLAGRPFVQISPILIIGAPGSGKTRLARRIGEELGLSVTVYGCSSVADGTLLSTSRQWSTGRASTPLQTIRRFDMANPMIVLDEIEKAGTRKDNGSVHDAVLGLTEQESARRHFDSYLEIETDLSAVNYVATANSLDGLSAALLSRFKVVTMPVPTLASLPVLARSLAAEIRQERGQSADWMPDLDGEELALVAAEWGQREPSVRLLRRLVETVLAGRDGLAPRH